MARKVGIVVVAQTKFGASRRDVNMPELIFFGVPTGGSDPIDQQVTYYEKMLFFGG